MCGQGTSFFKFFHVALAEAVRGLRELFFPRKCVVCGRVLSIGEEDICEACIDGLPLTWQWCVVQNTAFERMARRFDVEAAASLIRFGSESDYRHIVYGIKYGGRRALAVRMGRMLGGYLASSGEFRRCQAVVPVPLHPLRRWKRGYNQAELIARGVAEALGIPLETRLLRRRRHTRTQTRLHGAAKARNVAGAFAVDAAWAGRLREEGLTRILLVDDVLTTGSTLAACAAPLIPEGFRMAVATLAIAG